MYPVLINQKLIPYLLIHPFWFFNGPERIDQAWSITFLDDPNFTYDFLAQRFTGKNIDREESPSECDRHLGKEEKQKNLLPQLPPPL